MSNTASNSAPIIETKVKASTAGSYIGALLLMALADGVQNEGSLILGGLPDWLEPFIVALLPAVVTFATGYLAKHTHRPDLRRPPELNL